MNSKKRQTHSNPFIGTVTPRQLSIGFLVVVAASYPLLSIGSRLLAEGLPPMTQVYMRIGLATVALGTIFRKKIRLERLLQTSASDRWVLFTMGTIGYSIAVHFVTLGALQAKLVNVAVIFASVPFFSYLYSFIFLKKPMQAKLMLLLLCSLIGISFVATKSFVPRVEAFGSGEFFTLLATATMAWFFVGRKLLSTHLNTHEITIAVMMIATISGWLLALASGETFSLTAFQNPHVLAGLAIGGFLNVLINPIEIYAFQHLDAVFGSQILLLENIFALFLGFIFYGELITLPEILGGLIVVGCVALANKLPQ